MTAARSTLLSGRAFELARAPDLARLAGTARDLGHEVVLIERPMPEAVSVLGIGRALEIVSVSGGVAAEDAAGRRLDEEPGEPVAAAARLWRRLAPAIDIAGGAVAVGGFAFDPTREPSGPWAGLPAVLLRVPALAIKRARGRTHAVVIGPDAEEIMEAEPPAPAAPRARELVVESIRDPADWQRSVGDAVRRLRAGEAEKVVLAREVTAHADGVVTAGDVVRALRASYPSCFTYLVTGADGTAFAGASPELLVRRSGLTAVSQPMAGSAARGEDEAEDERLAAELAESSKNRAEHRVTARTVADALAGLAEEVEAGEPEVVRFTNIQHLATTVRARLRPAAAPSALDLAAALHPTPAVSGHPLAAARRLIDELEGMERGWYAGAVGWTDARGDGEYAVALRCGLLWEDGARLFAGVGVMPDSDPVWELRETELKLEALLGALAG